MGLSTGDATLAATWAQSSSSTTSSKKQELAHLFEAAELGRIDPEHLTDRQEALLNAALARQARFSVDRIAEAKLKRIERARAGRLARRHMAGDREALQAFMSGPLCSGYQEGRRRGMRGRGIVIAAGGPMQLANAYATLKTLREHLHCTLPVELFYNGPWEMDNRTRDFFQVRALWHSGRPLLTGVLRRRQAPDPSPA